MARTKPPPAVPPRADPPPPAGTNRRFVRRSLIHAPAADLFAWHARPGAFERLTPAWSPVRIVSRTGGIEPGARVVLDVPVGPVSTRWEVEHRDYVEGRQFRDVQLEGPFARWEHTHLVHAETIDTSTLADVIDFRLPLSPLSDLVAGWFADGQLDRLFAHRHAVTAADLTQHRAANPSGRTLQIAITGASGFIGGALDAYLTTAGHTVRRIGRSAPRPGSTDIRWDPARGILDPAALVGVDAVVHLAGENVGQRWTPEVKRRILESRVQGTGLLARTLAALDRKPAVLVSASGVGIYGDRGDETLHERSTLGSDFLADVSKQWEGAADPARAAGIRVVHPRTGVVLSPDGGALERLLLPFRMGVGGPIGSGKQWMSWITRDDLLAVIEWCIFRDGLDGAVNAVAPTPVTNAEFVRTLGAVLHRPALLPVPGLALRLLFGDMADATILASQRVQPSRLQASGFAFRHRTLHPALAFVLGATSDA